MVLSIHLDSPTTEFVLKIVLAFFFVCLIFIYLLIFLFNYALVYLFIHLFIFLSFLEFGNNRTEDLIFYLPVSVCIST